MVRAAPFRVKNRHSFRNYGAAGLIWASLFGGLTGCAVPPAPHIALTQDGGAALTGDDAVNLRLARASRAAGDVQGAIVLLRKIAENRKKPGEIMVELGDTLAGAGMVDDALEAYGDVDPAGPMGIRALLGVTRAYFALDDYPHALAAADRAVAAAPRDPRTLVNRGAVLDAMRRHEEAQAAYRAALDVTPRHAAARNNLALSLAFSGKYDEALAIMVPLARSSAATPQIRSNLALIYGLSGDSGRALAASRIDLDEVTAAGNQEYFAWVRGQRP